MTYRINKTDGTQLVDIPDGTLDTNVTSLTLIGRNSTSFGESINENFVKLLENFCSASAPEQAIKGQLWYNTTTGRINVFDGTNFRAAGGPIVSPSVPTDLVTGDLWINNETNQLWIYDGADLALAGPLYTNQQGVSGFAVETILDRYNRSQVITKLSVGGTLLGIFSKTEFVPAQPIVGYSEGNPLRPIRVGFNVGTFTNIKFDVTSTRAESILTDTGDIKTASQLLYNDEDGTIFGGLTVSSDVGITIGATNNVTQSIAFDKFIIEQQKTAGDIGIRVKTPTGTVEAITVDATNARVGIFNTTPTTSVDIGGSLKISGDLIVGGDTITVNTTTMVVEDKNIELGNSSEGTSNISADGGGITLLAGLDGNKTFNWYNDTGSWTSSENVNVVLGKTYKVNGITVLSDSALGAGVTTSSLTSLGQLNNLQMFNGLSIAGNTISAATDDIVLMPTTGAVDVSGRKIINLGTPTNLQDVTNKTYVDDAVFRRPISLSMDITGLADNNEIAARLNQIAPFYHPTTSPNGTAINGTILYLHTTTTIVTVSPITYSPTEGIEYSRTTVSGVSVVSDITKPQTIVAPSATVTVVRQNKKFIMGRNVSGQWGFDSDF